MLDKKELKHEELKKISGGNYTENNVPEVGKLYNKDYSYYARITSVNKSDDIVSYDIGYAEYDASINNCVVHTIGNDTKLIWDFLDEWDYYPMLITWE